LKVKVQYKWLPRFLAYLLLTLAGAWHISVGAIHTEQTFISPTVITSADQGANAQSLQVYLEAATETEEETESQTKEFCTFPPQPSSDVIAQAGTWHSFVPPSHSPLYAKKYLLFHCIKIDC
jgi:hypothetical protein